MIRYRECQKNHAAHLGNRVVDGCGEFMPAGDEGTPQALRCAACDCHRNFHRREVDGGETTPTTTLTPPPLLLHPPTLRHSTTTTTTTPGGNRFISFNNNNHQQGAVMMAFGGGGAVAESSSEELNEYRQAGSKKRFRTKFTPEDKNKMMECAEKIGWRLHKDEEEQVQKLCNELGIKRKVFKVWMHNNKQSSKTNKLP
ncbi:hypothetical protein RND81_13G185600 [Saponaria officinalis]|uniref:ZF-HD dimerization-type domain-containing protein n=1 Tax=Saponaria officinalis TaxID=3572 RepID=A0AAW1H404_SAPOF